MKRLKMAWRNVLLHRTSTLVLAIVFTVSTFVLFWSFGFGNNIARLVRDINRDSYGDIAFITDYFEKSDLLNKALRYPGVHRVVFERELKVMLDGPEKSTMVTLCELTPENMRRLRKYVRPVEGSLPGEPDEMVVTDFIQKGLYKVGDTVYTSTSTPNKILNALQYRVTGVAKSSAFKAIGYGFLVSEESMDLLINSKLHANLIYIHLHKGAQNKKRVKRVRAWAESILRHYNIPVRDSWDIVEREQKLSVFSLVFASMKPLMLIIIFPLIGAVIAAIVWIYSFKRRREIWTYVSLGMKDRHVVMTLALEYWIIAALGMTAGFAAGFASPYLCEAGNVWLQFSYTFTSPVGTTFHFDDLAVIVVFTQLSVLLWMWIPVRKIVHSVPFSY